MSPLDIVYYVAASLDGFIATPDGGVDWLAPFEGGDEDYGYAAFYAAVDALLLGRRTYEQALGFGAWPYDDKPCWVFSRRTLPGAPARVTATAASPREVVDGLARRGVGRAWLVGGGELAGSFRDQGLITDYMVSVVPVVLGAGVPLFGAVAGARAVRGERLRLVESAAFESGIVQLHHRRLDERPLDDQAPTAR